MRATVRCCSTLQWFSRCKTKGYLWVIIVLSSKNISYSATILEHLYLTSGVKTKLCMVMMVVVVVVVVVVAAVVVVWFCDNNSDDYDDRSDDEGGRCGEGINSFTLTWIYDLIFSIFKSFNLGMVRKGKAFKKIYSESSWSQNQDFWYKCTMPPTRNVLMPSKRFFL